MIRRFGLVYTVFSLVVLVVLVFLVLARLSTARSANMDEAAASFRRLRTQLQTQVGPDAVSEALRDYATIVPTVESLVVFNPDRGLLYVWAVDSELIAIPLGDLDDFTGFPSYRLRDVPHVRFREQLEAGVYLDAVYRVLGFTDAYVPLRDSLVALLVFAFITVVVALSLGRADPAAAAPTTGRTEPAASPEPRPPDVRAEPAAAPESHEPSCPSPEDADLDYEEIPLDEISTSGEAGSLFDAVTGLSHTEHLERRLGLELERAAYNDQDLTCLLVRFPAPLDRDAYAEHAKQILATFQFADLCFQYDETTFCVVLPNTELPQGIRQAESFHARHPSCRIGLSARNGRLVEARRLLTETERSLEHAAEEDGGIVGFRPDPRKYRQFVTRNQADEG